jgi:hypothetical protein
MMWMEYANNVFATLDRIFIDVVEYFAMFIWMDEQYMQILDVKYEKCYLLKKFGYHMFMNKDLKD